MVKTLRRKGKHGIRKTFKKNHCSLKNSNKDNSCLDDKLLIKKDKKT